MIGEEYSPKTMLRKSQKQLTTRFLHRTVLFFTALSVALALFFLFGNMQSFLDSTQGMILSALSATSLISAILAVVLIGLEVFFLFSEKKRLYALLIGMCLVCLIIAGTLALGSRVIMLLSAGF